MGAPARYPEVAVAALTYAEVGATESLPMPAGYHHLRYRRRIGAVSLDAAASAVLTFAVHRASGVQMRTDAARAVVGAPVTVIAGIGPLRLAAPCQVVAVYETGERRGFAYGTLPGHPERGEEAFLVSRETDGEVWFEVRAFSRPASLITKLGGPIVPLGQRAYAWNLGRTLRRLMTRDISG
jgi:uncharacterized protein (UPF0548 family)